MHNIMLHEDYLPLATLRVRGTEDEGSVLASSLPETTLAAVPVELLSTDLDLTLALFPFPLGPVVIKQETQTLKYIYFAACMHQQGYV